MAPADVSGPKGTWSPLRRFQGFYWAPCARRFLEKVRLVGVLDCRVCPVLVMEARVARDPDVSSVSFPADALDSPRLV